MRILLADDQTRVRFALRVFLEQQVGLNVVGEATNAGELLVLAGTTCPDIVLFGWGLPGMAMRDLLSAIRKIYPQIYIVVLSERQESQEIALSAGADAFVSKTNPPEQLLSIIGECWRKWQAKSTSLGTNSDYVESFL